MPDNGAGTVSDGTTVSGWPSIDAGLLNPLGHGSREAQLTSDSAWLQAMVDAELALTRALIDAELVPDWMSAVCGELTNASLLDLAAISAQGRGGGNPVIPLVKHLGAAAEAVRAGASDHIHVGATSQDILDTAAMLVAHRVTAELISQLTDLAATLARLAADHRDTVMAGRTLGQQASPTSFGFLAAGWLDAVLAVLHRVDDAHEALPAQLGGAVGNLAVLTEIARTRQPDAPAQNTVDAVVHGFARHLRLVVPQLSWHTNRLVIADLAGVLATAAAVAGNIALDVSVLSRTEIGEVSERLGAGEGGSSAMPHKRNPVSAVLVVAAARQTPGLASTLMGSVLAEDQRPSGSWHAEWQPLRTLEGLSVSAVTGVASLAARLDIDPERMRANLEHTDGLIFSERVTTILAEALGKTAAFDVVQRAAREAFETNRPLQIVLAGVLASDGRDDALRSRIWDVFTGVADLGQSSVVIDRVLDRYRNQCAQADTAPESTRTVS
ncbi:3-carboxy-cis,cis-muconate cycloisomerase [Cryobacterium levicorallinum]|uniref:3-carboxy-cis,cis-muconate cycloisomerase n=1 Tax=Cryobacterium levicorallinum TaxID=995038 RepID=A0A1I2ZY32_9MICO|nr:lyase family protein [Cryobacterium levicorallinum]TFB82773.1 3-carboxy-cis,cis-muconate cycloisomerase [Cryobacterium levicorallinum]GEP26477.1 3-carboxy-cis,cis-muconate cycloisomerase [Cryobacterium levicorallinum]SFH42812.1 3-carboxy-cis,cis-muconate cycloisomerase [Cryobacterium levicorallinum]